LFNIPTNAQETDWYSTAFFLPSYLTFSTALLISELSSHLTSATQIEVINSQGPFPSQQFWSPNFCSFFFFSNYVAAFPQPLVESKDPSMFTLFLTLSNPLFGLMSPFSFEFIVLILPFLPKQSLPSSFLFRDGPCLLKLHLYSPGYGDNISPFTLVPSLSDLSL